MTVSTIKTLAAATILGLGMITAQAVQAETPKRANISFKVKVKVDGNVSTIDKGLSLQCSITYERKNGTIYSETVNRLLLRAGQLYVPQTDDGYIEAVMTLPDQPIEFNHSPAAQNGELLWTCQALTGFGTPYVDVINEIALPPAAPGSCALALGYLSQNGQVLRPEAKCTKQ